MRRTWASLGLRGRLALSIAAIVIAAFAFVFVAVRAEMAHESSVIKREESREQSESGTRAEPGEGSGISPIADAQSDAEKALLLAGGAALLAALLAGYLLAARTASPLRRFAATAAEVDGGDLTPRLNSRPADAEELRTLAEAFNHMLDRLDRAFAQQRRFVSDASHELRSPLTAIRGQLEVLARNDSPSAEDVRRVEAMTMKEMGRVERLVDDLLALARLDEGVGLELREVQVTAFLGDLTAAEPNETTEAGELCGGQFASTPTSSPRSSATCSQMPAAMPAPMAGSCSPRGPPIRASSSVSTTTVRASRPRSASASSIASTAARPPATAPPGAAG